MNALVVDGITVTFDRRSVLDRFSMQVEDGEVVAVMGASGSGKSTLLRAIAGLQPIQSGTITIGGVDATTLPIHRRQIGFVFQDLALFPHLNVGENLAYGLKRHGFERATRTARVQELLSLVGLPDAADRSVTTLSGGEQQRVAIARAVAPHPKLLLLDEPLAALDSDRKTVLLDELGRIIAAANAAAIYVTHDVGEAERIADRVVFLT